MIAIISGDNVALLTDYTLAAFHGPEDMMHRDTADEARRSHHSRAPKVVDPKPGYILLNQM